MGSIGDVETYRPAFTDPPGTDLAGIPITNLDLPSPDVSYGLPYYDACTKHLRDTFKASKVYIIASRSLSANTDRVQKLASTLEAAGLTVVGVRKGITPHTPWSEILEMTADIRRLGADSVVTVGAGSITDGAKIALLAHANGIDTPAELSRYSVESNDLPKSVERPKLPLITIPTSLSGGEYFSLGGGTDDATNHKQGFLHSGMGSKLIILDPELCLGTPPYHWLSTGIRSFDHCVETLCSLKSTAKSDERAEKGLRLLTPNLLKCKASDTDIDARLQCQLAVNYAMDSIRAGIPMGGSHAIGHQLGPLGVPHGVTSCIMCPAVMKYNIKYSNGNKAIQEKQDKVREILWSEPDVAKTLTKAGLKKESADLGDVLDAIIRSLELPRSLKDMGIATKDIPGLATRALDDFWAPTNPVPLLKAEQVSEILEAVAV